MIGQTRDHNTLKVQYLENSWRCYLIYQQSRITSCEAVRSAILETAWLLYSVFCIQKYVLQVVWNLKKTRLFFLKCRVRNIGNVRPSEVSEWLLYSGLNWPSLSVYSLFSCYCRSPLSVKSPVYVYCALWNSYLYNTYTKRQLFIKILHW